MGFNGPLRRPTGPWLRRSRRPIGGRWLEAAALTLIAVLALVAYGWDLDVQRWANPYYSAVAQAGSQRWSSFFLGSLETGNAVSSDKPPLAFWPMALAVRAFGLSSVAILLPQVLETIAGVVLLHLTVRRVGGTLAGLLAATAYATTPVVLVMARYNHPDTLMTALTIGAAYCVLRALDAPGGRWLVAAGVLLGLAFLTKWATCLLPVPGMAAALLLDRQTAARERFGRLATVAGAAACTALVWVAPAVLLPPAVRPYADGSHGSILDLVVGRDGLSRLGGSGPVGASSVSGAPGPLRLLTPPFDGQIGWLLPVAVLVLVLSPLYAAAAARPGIVLFGGWFTVTAVVFSVMTGALHPYYSVLLAPAAAALVGIGTVGLCRRRWSALVLAATAVGLVVQDRLRAASDVPGRHWVMLIVAGALIGALIGVLIGANRGGVRGSRGSRLGAGVGRLGHDAVAAIAVVGLIALPTTVGLGTLRHAVTGYDPLAGPSGSAVPADYPRTLTAFLETGSPEGGWLAAVPRATAASLLQLQAGDDAVLPLGGFTGHALGPSLTQVQAWVASGRLRFLVLPRDYSGYPNDIPPSLTGYPVAAILQWASRDGCPTRVVASRFTVVDLGRHGCHEGVHAAPPRAPGGPLGQRGTDRRSRRSEGF